MRLGLVAIALLLFATTACPQKQEQRTYLTHADGNVPLIPTSHSELPQLPGIRISWYHGSTKQLVMLRLDNVSAKNINAYNVSIRLKFTDGSTNPFAPMDALASPVNTWKCLRLWESMVWNRAAL